jgi:hypothetical protein
MAGEISEIEHEVAQAEEEVKNQRETIAFLTAEGRDVKGAQRQLVAMLENLTFLLKLR